MGSLVLVADGASLDKVTGVLLQGGPPEALEEDVSGPLGTWMAGEFGGVGPTQNLRPQGFRDAQAVGWACAGYRLTFGGGPHYLLYVPGQGGDDTGRRKDRSRPLSKIFPLLELSGQGVRLGVARPWTVGKSEAEAGEEKGPMGLVRVQSLGSADVFKIVLVSPNQEGFLSTLQPMLPLTPWPSLPPAALCSQCHSFSRQETGAERRRHRGGASGQRRTFGTRRLLPPRLRHPPPPRTGDQGQASGGWALR